MPSPAPTTDHHDQRAAGSVRLVRIADRLRELLEPTTTRENQWLPSADGTRLEPRPHVVEHPPLLEQLAQAVPASTAGASGGGFESRPAGNIEVLDALSTMEREAAIWAQAITRAPAVGALPDLLRLLGDRAPTLEPDDLRDLDRDVLRWWARARIATTWDTAPLKPHVACMSCDRRGGIRVAIDPLAAVCIYCGTAWDSTTIGILGEHIRLMLADPIDQPTVPQQTTGAGLGGHGETPWHCSCHGRAHGVPSIAYWCEQRAAAAATRAAAR